MNVAQRDRGSRLADRAAATCVRHTLPQADGGGGELLRLLQESAAFRESVRGSLAAMDPARCAFWFVCLS